MLSHNQENVIAYVQDMYKYIIVYHSFLSTDCF